MDCTGHQKQYRWLSLDDYVLFLFLWILINIAVGEIRADSAYYQPRQESNNASHILREEKQGHKNWFREWNKLAYDSWVSRDFCSLFCSPIKRIQCKFILS